MNKYFKVFEVYEGGLLDCAFLNYEEALSHCRYLMRLGCKPKIKTRQLDESEY